MSYNLLSELKYYDNRLYIRVNKCCYTPILNYFYSLFKNSNTQVYTKDAYN